VVEALSAASGWPAATASLAVVRPTGVCARWGPTSHPFPLASVTKLFAACAALVAVEEGTLDLDEPAGPAGSTVRHLLAHASGLGPDSGELAAVGARRIYSNAGFDALAAHLADRAGMPAEDYVTAAVLEPLGLDHTRFATPSLAHGLVSTVHDVARFAQELLRPTLIAAQTLAEATQPQFPGLAGVLPGFGSMAPNDWGLGFELRSEKDPHWTGRSCSPATYGHFGRAGTFLWVDPESDLALVALTNKVFGEWAKSAWPAVSDEVIRAVAATPRPD
jgi:CubicO group peptidase (beta-lactamase class C family)